MLKWIFTVHMESSFFPSLTNFLIICIIRYQFAVGVCLNFSEWKKLFVNIHSVQQCLIFYLVLFLSPITFGFFLLLLQLRWNWNLSSYFHFSISPIHHLFAHFICIILELEKSKYNLFSDECAFVFHFSKTFSSTSIRI